MLHEWRFAVMLFVQLGLGGSMKYARATMDRFSVEEPKVIESQRGWYVDGSVFDWDISTVFHGLLYLHANIAQTINIYDAETTSTLSGCPRTDLHMR